MKRLSEEQFQRAVAGLEIGPRPLTMARAVLVEGRSQADLVKEFQVTKGAVSQAVNRVWEAWLAMLPPGYQRVEVVLPEHQAYIVQKWAQDAKRKGANKA